MTIDQAAELIASNARDLAYMEENVREGFMVEESQKCANALHAQMLEAKRVLQAAGVFAV